MLGIMLRIRGELVLILTLLVAGSYAGAQAPPAKAADAEKTALIEELIVALKAEQNQQQIMQTVQNAMLGQINQMVDSQLKSLGTGSQADAEKARDVQADIQDFQRRLFALMTAHMSWQTMKPIYVAM